MPTVTGLVSSVKQPRGGFLTLECFRAKEYSDELKVALANGLRAIRDVLT